MSAVLCPYLMGYKVISYIFAMSFINFYPQGLLHPTHSETHISIQSKLIVCLRINYGDVLRNK